MPSDLKRRREALERIQSLPLPEGWGPYNPHLNFSGWRFHQERGLGMSFAALGSSPGMIEVRCGGMVVTAESERLAEAVEHCLKWNSHVVK